MTVQFPIWKPLALIVCGLAFVALALIDIGFHPEYWEPRTLADHAAVIFTSLSLITLAWALWGSFIKRPSELGRAEAIMRIALTVTCIASVTVGICNFVEDWFDINVLGIVRVVGVVTLTAAMLVGGIAAFWVPGISRWKAVLLTVGSYGMFVIPIGALLFGFALIGSALSRPKTNVVIS